jgi:acyl-CoA synthetase (AMP-forming)/AMP-acid ligase II
MGTDNLDHTLHARAARHAGQRPDDVAVIFEGREVTFAQFHRRSNRTAHALLAAGLRRGARVAFLGKESDHYYDIVLGCAKSGTVLVPVNWRLTPTEIDHILRDSQAELLFVEHEFVAAAERVRAELPNLRTIVKMDHGYDRAVGFLDWRAGYPDTDLEPGTDSEDPVVQLYTSGTTGLPKGVVLAHRTFFTFIQNTTRAGVTWLDWYPHDRTLSCFPGLHASGMTWFFHSFNAGATIVVMRMFIAQEAVRVIEAERITTTWLAPAMLQMMLDEPGVTADQFRSLRKVVYSGSPITLELLNRCMDTFTCDLAQVYAAAETGSCSTILAPEDHVPGSPVLSSAGRICPGNQIRIVDRDGNELPPGEIGQVCISSPAHFIEYWHLPEATAKTLVDGWVMMGDAGYLDERGYLYLCDRINDTIIVAGQNIYPVEVENVIRNHPGVADVAVFGVTDPRWGEAVRAAVVPRDGHAVTARELMVFLHGRLADYKAPTGYVFVETLPRNPTGKVLRRVLRDEHGPSAATDRAPVATG